MRDSVGGRNFQTSRLLHPDHSVGEGEEWWDMVVKREGAAPIVVARNGYRHVHLAGDLVDAGAGSPLEKGVGLGKDRVQVH